MNQNESTSQSLNKINIMFNGLGPVYIMDHKSDHGKGSFYTNTIHVVSRWWVGPLKACLKHPSSEGMPLTLYLVCLLLMKSLWVLGPA